MHTFSLKGAQTPPPFFAYYAEVLQKYSLGVSMSASLNTSFQCSEMLVTETSTVTSWMSSSNPVTRPGDKVTAMICASAEADTSKQPPELKISGTRNAFRPQDREPAL